MVVHGEQLVIRKLVVAGIVSAEKTYMDCLTAMREVCVTMVIYTYHSASYYYVVKNYIESLYFVYFVSMVASSKQMKQFLSVFIAWGIRNVSLCM